MASWCSASTQMLPIPERRPQKQGWCQTLETVQNSIRSLFSGQSEARTIGASALSTAGMCLQWAKEEVEHIYQKHRG